ncbi:PREDICTED: uncharacterized protein LOC105368505 [Ceratosolen solmsi marchali]|uniref:Uncharacterized protein LOC105368505 n=1 Tax=Ceratosolen solmsi marchali TaxID=326594 RepID=A0AAJ6YWT5_9HYME|nr:PREDICTED: uncharacterized protein LOC105368505 [Ceratosolen solmsi marchali]
MERQDDEEDSKIDSFSWTRRNVLEKSKSSVSINAIGDCNYRNQGIQISLENCNMPRKVISTLENLNLADDNDDIDDIDTNFVPNIMQDYDIYNQFDNSLLRYGIKTQDITTKQIIIQGSEILNFQGNKHSHEEIARFWKKDCRKWLWKSVKYAKQNEIESIIISDQSKSC